MYINQACFTLLYQVKLQAAQLVQGLTGTADGLAALATTAHDLLPSLLRLLPTAQPPELAPCALAALVNISQDASMAAALVDARAIGRAADYLNEGPPHLPARLLVMLLANLTTRPEGATQLVQGSGRRPPGTYMYALLLYTCLFVYSHFQSRVHLHDCTE